MATQRIPYIARPHVRPVVITWSRWLAGGVLAVVFTALIVVGFLALIPLLMHSSLLVALLLISIVAVALIVFLPSLLPKTPGQGQG